MCCTVQYDCITHVLYSTVCLYNFKYQLQKYVYHLLPPFCYTVGTDCTDNKFCPICHTVVFISYDTPLAQRKLIAKKI